MRVLISAYACDPDQGSEPGIGWAMLSAAAIHHEVTVMTTGRSADRVRERMCARGSFARVLAVDSPAWLGRYEGRLGLGHLDYLLWQLRAIRTARSLEPEIDVAHHVTFGNDWLPCALHFLRTVPVVWGPVGGAAPFPWRLASFMSPSGLTRELARELITRAGRLLTVAAVRRRDCVVVGVNQHVTARYERLGLRVSVEPQVAVSPLGQDSVEPKVPMPVPVPNGSHRALFIARLLAWKGPYIALSTLAELPDSWRLEVFGTGPEERGLRRRAERLGISERVRFVGHRPLAEVRQALREADVMLHPTMRDVPAFIVAEAVRAGCPVVALDLGAPPSLLETGGEAAGPADRHAPRQLAEAVLRARRGVPSDRWSASRFVDRVDGWYRLAVGGLPQR